MMNSSDERSSVVVLRESLILLLEAACLVLRMREFILDSRDAPGICPLKKDANAGIDPTIMAT